jgi:porphobilinogen synthase
VQTATRALKKEIKDLLVLTDVCLCEYTSHGHCGVLDGDHVVNDPTVDGWSKPRCRTPSRADFVAPSDMMDGRVAGIRQALDAKGFDGTGIVSYSAKYCSGSTAVPRGRRFHTAVRRPADAPDGSGQRRGGAARRRHRHRGRRGRRSW